ncbi:MAG TPA: T9SS type A sorting domain-containing protein [Flavisolibacter sp.]|jgi:hypothetical protein|nr:T9SS type A sorting domain-containing protein [Flavisolibacter sp.]
MRTILLGICIFISSIGLAQRECTSSAYLETQKMVQPDLQARLQHIQAFIDKQLQSLPVTAIGTKENGNQPVYKIPVVVHVLYNNAAQNISDAMVKSQIDALNRDFRRTNADTSNTPDRFKEVAADVQIEFALATADPKGRPTSGIVRKATNTSYWRMDDKIKFSAQGGDDAWDSRYYLNIWVGNLQSTLAYSSVPGGPADKDGIVVALSAFGTINVGGAFNMGRTVVHETGHWLGLLHIWGDSYCGDDLVGDTPKQGNFTSGCPSGFRSSCSNGTTGDMYMNYMDYTNDACLNLFTEGQKQRMRSLFASGGPRSSILASRGLDVPWMEAAPLEELPVAIDLKVYPNPAASQLTLTCNASWIGKNALIINMNGSVLSSTPITATTQKFNVSSLRPGIYYLQADQEGEKIRVKFVKL